MLEKDSSSNNLYLLGSPKLTVRVMMEHHGDVTRGQVDDVESRLKTDLGLSGIEGDSDDEYSLGDTFEDDIRLVGYRRRQRGA